MAKTKQNTDIKDTALLKLLPVLAFEGWSDTAVKQAAENDDDIAAADFKHATDVARYMSDWADRRMSEKIENMSDFSDLKIREKIFTCVKTRLDVLLPHKVAMKASAKYMMGSPFRARLLPKMIWTSADQMWWLAGDRSTDYNYYSKRSLLSGVISTTTAYWLKDTSEEHEKTKTFLKQRIENVLSFGKVIGKVKKAGKRVFNRGEEKGWD